MFIGRWDEEELEALSKSVRRLTNTKKGVSVTSKIPWITVAQDIKTSFKVIHSKHSPV